MNFDNQGMMHEAIYRRNGHHVIGKDGVLLTKGLVRSDQETAPFVAMGNHLKEDRGFGL